MMSHLARQQMSSSISQDVPGTAAQFEEDDLSEVAAGCGFKTGNSQENETYFFYCGKNY